MRQTEREEEEEQDIVRRIGTTRPKGVDAAEEDHRMAARVWNLTQFHPVTEEMFLRNQTWKFNFETAAEEAARVGGSLFGKMFEGTKFTVGFSANFEVVTAIFV